MLHLLIRGSVNRAGILHSPTECSVRSLKHACNGSLVVRTLHQSLIPIRQCRNVDAGTSLSAIIDIYRRWLNMFVRFLGDERVREI